MLSIVSDNTNTPVSRQHCTSIDFPKAYKAWKAHTNNAYYFHQRKDLTKAIHHFKEALTISKKVRNVVPEDHSLESGLAMFYQSSHNLSACLNAERKAQQSIDILNDLYTSVMSIAKNKFKTRPLRLEALANLDKSLFSLVSQLGYVNDTSKIHDLILKTEIMASQVSRELQLER